MATVVPVASTGWLHCGPFWLRNRTEVPGAPDKVSSKVTSVPVPTRRCSPVPTVRRPSVAV
ncbi:MAG: hypothetical protein GEV28_32265 [Actinophytocola sp.]|uniref:hypothetical protein n=1 Tax=Actinophytocola sp. TaxID=1872138 RepID=UPI001328DAFD|nr:hypothetical protein [Actinophytocola sp.]MPZ84809.1 hypothetical protein [Actinophytocola sp.]